MTKATVICDSRNEFGQRITTFIITFPRYLLAEFNTHRMLSRNSASSRAIRFEKMVQSVMDNPFISLRWQKDHPGMQGTEYFEGEDEIIARGLWLEARNIAIDAAKKLNSPSYFSGGESRVTKQICNRLLEPFMFHTCLCTGTEWENFFALRAHKDAEIHFQDLAEKMLVAINESEPKQLKAGEWHIPFGDQLPAHDIKELITKLYPNQETDLNWYMEKSQELRIKIATFRCAQISYLSHENSMSYEKMLEKHDGLATAGHWSAFEHCARAMSADEFNFHSDMKWIGGDFFNTNKESGWSGNYKGFIQYRKMFQTENRSDSRLIKK